MSKQRIIFKTNIGKDKPNTLREKKDECPFCNIEQLKKEGNILEINGDKLLLKNKYPVLSETFQTVYIESQYCDGHLSNYPKEILYDVISYVIKKWLSYEKDERFKSVCLIKNHGQMSGGSIHHPHMQIIGFDNIDCYESVETNDFIGSPIFQNEKIEVNISTKPKGESYEFNILIHENENTNQMAEWIQKITYFILNDLNKHHKSYNLVFYHYQGKIICKIINRFPNGPFLFGYQIGTVPDNLEEVKNRILKQQLPVFYF